LVDIFPFTPSRLAVSYPGVKDQEELLPSFLYIHISIFAYVYLVGNLLRKKYHKCLVEAVA